MKPSEAPAVVPLAYQRKQAAQAAGVSPDTFDRHIRPHVPCIYVGATRLWRVATIDAWLEGQEVQQVGSPSTTEDAPALVEQPGARHER